MANDYNEMFHARQIVDEVMAEREYQINKWGGYTVDDERNSPFAFVGYIVKYAMKWFKGGFPSLDKEVLQGFRKSMVQVAALSVSAAQWADRYLETTRAEADTHTQEISEAEEDTLAVAGLD